MTPHGFTWRLTEPRSPQGDAVGAALGFGRAKLTYGPFELEFAKSRSPNGELVLSLRRDGGVHAGEPESLLERNEQVVPSPAVHLPAVERERLEASYLRAFGRALFEDVARLAHLELQFNGQQR